MFPRFFTFTGQRSQPTMQSNFIISCICGLNLFWMFAELRWAKLVLVIVIGQSDIDLSWFINFLYPIPLGDPPPSSSVHQDSSICHLYKPLIHHSDVMWAHVWAHTLHRYFDGEESSQNCFISGIDWRLRCVESHFVLSRVEVINDEGNSPEDWRLVKYYKWAVTQTPVICCI